MMTDDAARDRRCCQPSQPLPDGDGKQPASHYRPASQPAKPASTSNQPACLPTNQQRTANQTSQLALAKGIGINDNLVSPSACLFLFHELVMIAVTAMAETSWALPSNVRV
jgi:hypothetical protein